MPKNKELENYQIITRQVEPFNEVHFVEIYKEVLKNKKKSFSQFNLTILKNVSSHLIDNSHNYENLKLEKFRIKLGKELDIDIEEIHNAVLSLRACDFFKIKNPEEDYDFQELSVHLKKVENVIFTFKLRIKEKIEKSLGDIDLLIYEKLFTN